MKKIILFSLFVALASCSKEEPSDSSTECLSNHIIQTQKNEVNKEAMFFHTNATRSSSEVSSYSYEAVPMQATGYTTTFIAAGKAKCTYKGSESPQTLALGLGAGVYFVEVIGVKKSLNTNHPKDIINPSPTTLTDKNMGLKTCGYYTNDSGWNTEEVMDDGDGIVNGVTYIIHFMYTLDGKSINKYYPCKPENLIWNYTSITLQ